MTCDNLPADSVLLAARQRVAPECTGGEVVARGSVQGDCLFAVAYPDRAELILMPSGGSLWGDIPVGLKRYVTLADQAWFFVAFEDAQVGPYQACMLAEAADGVSGLDVARTVCLDAAQLLGFASAPAQMAQSEAPAAPVSRRGFLRALTGRR